MFLHLGHAYKTRFIIDSLTSLTSFTSIKGVSSVCELFCIFSFNKVLFYKLSLGNMQKNLRKKKLIFFMCVLILICLIVYLIKKWKKRKENDKEEYETSNSKKDDRYIQLWNQEIFLPNSLPVNYIIAYHYIKNFPIIEKCVNIILDGEPANLEKVHADLVITTKKERLPNIPSIYVPFFTWTFVESNISPELLVKKSDEMFDDIIRKKSKFCCFMYSNCDEKMDGVKKRKIFFEMLNARKKVDNLGRCYNKNYKKNGGWNMNFGVYTPYKFVIAFENQEISGYITEKIIMPMIARAIPIYFGPPEISNFFNTKSFINVNDFTSFEKCIDYILEVDRNPILYQKILNEPFIQDNIIDKELFSVYYGGKFYRELYEKLPIKIREYIRPCKLYENNVRFITFADGNIYKNTRILKQAKTSGFFKECFGFTRHDLVDFPHKKFTKNKRGFGYWIWKPYLILQHLSQLDTGDYLIYCDSGSTINVEGYESVKKYFHLLENFDMIFFRIRHDEKKWNKMDSVLNTLAKNAKNRENVNIYEKINHIFNQDSKQRTSGLIILKKTLNSQNFIQKWYELCVEKNYENVDDTPSIAQNHPEFIEHRHDQSIFSVLSKFFESGICIDDNYSDEKDDFIMETGQKRPFVLTRLKK